MGDAFDMHTKDSLLCFKAFIVIAALLATNNTYLQHEQGGQGLIAGTNVPNCWVCSCLGLVQALFISTSVGSHTHTTHAML